MYQSYLSLSLSIYIARTASNDLPSCEKKGWVDDPQTADSSALDSDALDSTATSTIVSFWGKRFVVVVVVVFLDSDALASNAWDSIALGSSALDSNALNSIALESDAYDTAASDSNAFGSNASDSIALDSDALP